MGTSKYRLLASRITFILFFAAASTASAQVDPISLSDNQPFHKMGPHLEYFDDPFGKITIDDVSSPDFNEQFQTVGARHANFGITPSTIWLRFTVEGVTTPELDGQTNTPEEWMLDMGWSALTEVRLYAPGTDAQPWNILESGAKFPIQSDTDLLSRLRVLRLPLPSPGATETYYMEIKSDAAMLLPMMLRTADNYRNHSELLMLGYGAFFGLIAALILFNVISYAWVQDASPLWYASFLFFAFLYFFEFNMLQERFFPIADPMFMERLTHFFLSTGLLMLGPFYNSFMSVDGRSRVVQVITYLYIAVSIPAFLFTFIPAINLAFIKQYDTIVACGAMIMLASSVLVSARSNYRPAKVLSIAWLVFCGFLLVHVFTLWGILPLTTWIQHFLQVGIGIISAAFSYAIWFRLNGIREDRDRIIRESEARYNLLAENISDVIWTVDTEGIVTYISPSIERMRGYTPEEMIGHRFEEFMPAETAETLRTQMASALYPGGLESPPSTETRVFEVEQYKKNGEIIHMDVTASPILDTEGHLVELAGVARDVTERHAQEKERKRLEHEIQNARKLESLGMLAGGVAHDFNNILVSVMGYTGILLKKLTPQSSESGLVQKIETAAERASDLANHMLSYSGKRSLKLEPVNLNLIVNEMPELLESTLSPKADLQLKPAPQIPSINADATQLRQVAMNLILNASDALGEGAGTISVTTGSTFIENNALDRMRWGAHLPEGDFVFIEVTDTGCGMDEETSSKIFEPFFTTNFTGRGLGMAALLGIVRSHSGAIDLETEPEKGTTVRIYFPKTDSESNEPHTPSDSDETLHKPEGTVLVIDDDDFVRMALRSMLEDVGMNVLLASNGQEGIDLYQEKKNEIGIVLLDMTMPGMQGDEVFDKLKEFDPDAVIVIVTGYSEEDIDRIFKEKDLRGFLQKPFTEEELEKTIAVALAPSI